MSPSLFRALALRLVRLYHPRLGVDRPALPAGPWIVVANHPSGLIDPLVLQLALGQRLGFLAKAALFKNAAGRFAMEAFDAIAVARRHDGGGADADRQQNDATFAACRARLAQGKHLALFPEGISHPGPELAPLRTGAARIALSAVAEGTEVLHIVPVGLLYGHRQTFRSPVSALVGAPIDVGAFYRTHGDGVEAVRALTEAVREALVQVVLEAESAAIWQGLRVVAAVTDTEAGGAEAQTRIHRRALVLAEGFKRLSARDPERASALVAQAQAYLEAAEEAGLLAPEDDRAALVLEAPAPLGRLLGLLLALPLAAVGAVANWPTYRGIGRLANRLAGADTDVTSTYKLLGGMAFFPLTWLVWSVLGLCFVGPTGLLAGPVAAVTAPIALWVGERLDRRRRALRAAWLRLARAPVAFALAEQRRALAAAVEAALRGL